MGEEPVSVLMIKQQPIGQYKKENVVSLPRRPNDTEINTYRTIWPSTMSKDHTALSAITGPKMMRLVKM